MVPKRKKSSKNNSLIRRLAVLEAVLEAAMEVRIPLADVTSSATINSWRGPVPGEKPDAETGPCNCLEFWLVSAGAIADGSSADRVLAIAFVFIASISEPAYNGVFGFLQTIRCFLFFISDDLSICSTEIIFYWGLELWEPVYQYRLAQLISKCFITFWS